MDDSKSLRVAQWWYALLCHDSKYQGVRELVEASDLLAGPKLAKAMAFVQQPAESRVRTNNHVERLNRRLRFAETVRYRWRRRKWVVRWVVVLLDVCWQQAAEVAAAVGSQQTQVSMTMRCGGDVCDPIRNAELHHRQRFFKRRSAVVDLLPSES
jgi:hypothetical protein